MRPSLTSACVPNSGPVHHVDCRQPSVRRVSISANGSNITIGEFSPRVRLSPWKRFQWWASRTTALANHVFHVVVVSADKKMTWIHATRHVASMQHVEANRDRPIYQAPREAVSATLTTIYKDRPVTTSTRVRSIPRPAGISATDGQDVGPESLVGWHFWSLSSQDSTTTGRAGAGVLAISSSLKRQPANFALLGDGSFVHDESNYNARAWWSDASVTPVGASQTGAVVGVEGVKTFGPKP